MVVYTPLWKTMEERGITAYMLIYEYGFSSHTIHRLRNNGGISTSLINVLCQLLNCRVEDILLYIPDSDQENKI